MRVPRNVLDVLAQQVVAICCDGPDEFRRTAREMIREGVDTIKINPSGDEFLPIAKALDQGRALPLFFPELDSARFRDDLDGFEDDDGCHEHDNDADRIADVDDECPCEPEVYNGVDDADERQHREMMALGHDLGADEQVDGVRFDLGDEPRRRAGASPADNWPRRWATPYAPGCPTDPAGIGPT